MNADDIQNQPGTSPPPALVEELANELAKHPAPPPSAQHETPIAPPNTKDQGPLRQGRLYVEMRKPSGSLAWVPIDNEATYTAKGYVPTGEQADWDKWSVEEARAHKWHGVGRGQS